MTQEIKVGSTVMYREERIVGLLVEFAKKLRDRRGVVEAIHAPIPGYGYDDTYRVRWLKRNGRGKEFVERHKLRDLRLADPA